MANVKISALPAATSLDGTEVVPVVQGGATKKVDLDFFGSRAVTPEQYGAVGDGATNDATAIQAAIDAADGREVRLTKQYAIGSTLTIDRFGTSLVGDGMEYQSDSANPVGLLVTASNTPAIKVTNDGSGNGGADGVRLHGFTIEYETQQTTSDTAAVGVLFSDGLFSQFSARDLFISKAAIGVGIEQTGTSTVFASTFDNVRVNLYTICALDFRNYNGGGTGVAFTNVYTNAGGVTISEVPVRIAAGLDYTFRALHVEAVKARAGIEIDRSYSVTLDSTHFEQFTVHSSGDGLGFVRVLNSTLTNVSIRGLTFYDCDVLTADVASYFCVHSLSSSTNVALLDISGVTVHSTTTVTAASGLKVLSITSAATDSSADVRNVVMLSGTNGFVESPTGLVKRFGDQITPFERRRLHPALPTGAVAETHPREGRNSESLASLSTGRMSLRAIDLEAGQVVTTITFISGSTALVDGTRQWFALYSGARVLLGVTNDDTSTAWAASTAKTLTLASPYTVPVGGLYYLGIMVAATTTVPTLMGQSAVTATAGIAPILCGYDATNTGLTTPATAPNPAAAITANGLLTYAYVS